jgi:alpha-mannosidase II
MQDRRLNQDDDRGLGQGVLDNRPTLNIFRLLVENREACTKLVADYPAGYLSVAAFTAQKTMLHPLDKLIFTENEWTGMLPAFGGDHEPLEAGVEVVAFRELPHIRRGKTRAVGVVLHRNHFEKCTSDVNREGLVNLRKTFNFDEGRAIHMTNLTMLAAGRQVQTDELSMCPMSTKAFVIHR